MPQLSPLVLTDGSTQIGASLSPECLVVAPSLYSLVSVRKYTIRFTPYGPPCKQLDFILRAVDWLPGPCARATETNIETLVPLCSATIRQALRRLRNIRKRQDRRCLGTLPNPGEHHVAMNDGNDTYDGASQPHTQYAFNTQAAHPVHTRDPSMIGSAVTAVAQKEKSTPKAAIADLLSLLHKTTKPSVPTPTISPGNPDAFVEQSATQLPYPANAQCDEQRTRGSNPVEHLPDSTPCANAVNNVLSAKKKKKPNPSNGKSSSTNRGRKSPKSDYLQALVSECSWMKDLEFTHEALRVDKRQMSLLQRDESWHKPPPGKSFPEGNVPIEILKTIHKLADENNTSGAVPNSDDSMMEDLSPNSTIESADPSPQSVLQITQNEQVPSSPVSWEHSPTPEPPKPPPRIDQELPPDSSFEPCQTAPTDDNNQVSHSQPHETVTLSNSFLANSSLSSPPRPEMYGSDEETEMEAYIPHGLGDDMSKGTDSSQSPSNGPTVQVEQTPYLKAKTDRATSNGTQVQAQNLSPSRAPKSTSSTSIVHGTYSDVQSAPSPKLGLYPSKFPSQAEIPVDCRNEADTKSGAQRRIELGQAVAVASIEVERHESNIPTRLAKHTSRKRTNSQNLQTQESFSKSDSLASPSLLPTSTPTKRKLEASPSKKGSRQSKRRPIKLVGFGDQLPVPMDLASTLRQDREESLRRFREERQSSMSVERHLTADPTRDTASPSSESHKGALPEILGKQMSSTIDRSPSPPEQVGNHTRTITARPQNSPSSETTLKLSPVKGSTAGTIFAMFKAAYPEYTGDAKHFSGQCSQMYILDLEDRMVPKWQWDDYIIRSRTDFKNFALDCLDRGENAGEYIRFYKDYIRDTIFRKDIVKSRETLVQALQELNVERPDLQIADVGTQQQKSGLSLGSAHNSKKGTGKSQHNHGNLRGSRRSLPLPVGPQHNQCGQNLDHANQQNVISDPFRDFYFAYQRSTAFTGNSRVGSKLSDQK